MSVDTVVEQIHRLLLDNLPIKSSKTPSGWVIFDCVICSDKRKRAGVIVNGPKISYNCFNCGYKTGWNLSAHLGKKYKDVAEKLGATTKDIHNIQVELMKHSSDFEGMESREFTYNLSKFETQKFPEGVQLIEDLPDNHELKIYAQHRGILSLTPLVHFPDVTNRKRVVVPFFYNGELVGWSGRHISPPDKSTPKYLHNLQPGYVFNIDKFANNDRQIVIVTEGIFDAILTDGVSVLGNSVTPEQAHLIQRLGKRVILCPDRDKPGKHLIDQALELGWEISFPPWSLDCKDASDACQKYGRLLTVSSIIKHATDNKIKAQVKTKML